MAKKPNSANARPRLVVYVSPIQHAAIQKEVNRVGFKNPHAWAASELRFPIAKLTAK